MSAKSTYFATQVLELIRQHGRWISLHTADPGPNGENEVRGKGYARIPVLFSVPSKEGSVENVAGVTTEVPGKGAWEDVTHVGVWDSKEVGTGNFFFRVECQNPVATSEGVPLYFAPGVLRYHEQAPTESNGG